MQRIHLPNEGEHGWSYDPTSIEHLIEARLRREELQAKHLREVTVTHGPSPSHQKRSLGLTGVELDMIWREAWMRFLEGASLSDELRRVRQRFRERWVERVEYFKKNGDRAVIDQAEAQAVALSRDCERAIERATGEFADFLIQAVIARRGRKDIPLRLRAELWAESLRFAMRLAQSEPAVAWVQRAWGEEALESPVPMSSSADFDEERRRAALFSTEFRKVFEERIRHGSPQWLDAAERKMRLRILLSGAWKRRPNFDDPSKLAIATLLFRAPDLRAEQICAKLDAANERGALVAPVPHAWQKRGARSWLEAYARFPGNVKAYISKVSFEWPWERLRIAHGCVDGVVCSGRICGDRLPRPSRVQSHSCCSGSGSYR